MFGILMLSVFIGTAGYLYYKSLESPVIFETESPVIGDIENITVASGMILPRQEIQVKAQVSGILEEIYVQPGEEVQKGTALAKIRIVPDLVSLNEAQNRLDKARIVYADAQQEMEKQEKLHAERLISQSEFTRYQVRFKTAAADLEAAQNHVQLLKEGVAQQGTAANNTLIQSTVTGTVLEIPVKEGDTVVGANGFNPGTTVALIADMRDLVFEGSIDESGVGKLHEGMTLSLTIGALEGHEFAANLEYIAPKGHKEYDGAVQFRFKAAIEPEEGILLRSGYSANAKIVLAKKEGIVIVPESLIMYDNEQHPYVEVEIGEQAFEARPIEVGVSNGLYAEIISGITTADKVKKL